MRKGNRRLPELGAPGRPRAGFATQCPHAGRRLTAALFDTLSHRLAQVEIERITLQATRTADSMERRVVDQAIAELERRRSTLLASRARGAFTACG